jgi:hypothetical protein
MSLKIMGFQKISGGGGYKNSVPRENLGLGWRV